MTVVAVLVALVSAATVLVAGYQLGVARGSAARDELRRQVEAGQERTDLRAQLQGLHEVLGPLAERERLGHDLAHLELGTGRRGELPRLLDDISQRGGFGGVILSDEAGLPLAASADTVDLERFAGLSSLLMLLVDRMANGGPPPVAVVVHDGAGRQVLNRLFRAAGQQLILTAVVTGPALPATALDPALSKVEALLAPAGAQTPPEISRSNPVM